MFGCALAFGGWGGWSVWRMMGFGEEAQVSGLCVRGGKEGACVYPSLGLGGGDALSYYSLSAAIVS